MSFWICIPVFNRIAFTRKCLITLRAQTFQGFKIVICDHGSTDGTSELLAREFPEVIVIRADSSLWWTGAINVCVKYVLDRAANQDCLLTLNNDTEVPSDYLAEFFAYHNQYPRAVLSSVTHDVTTGSASSIGYRQNWLTAQSKAVTFDRHHLPDNFNVVEVTHASGRGTLFPIEVFRALGLYDEQRLPHYAADYDFSHKARREGYPIYVCKSCRVYSHIDATGMDAVRNQVSLKSFVSYFLSIRSPANISVRWWYGWKNCPRILFPTYITLDIFRVVGGYVKHVLLMNR
ncbi:MAG: hypothetical protein BVN35_05665 [Proteobacteria bacterium ST_bin11]|nr:MAG: hypothetical protein BVN35_05665 [Proteobacteria bacterium ST_bin11]